MYKIEKTDYGYKLIFGDFMQKEELEKWVSDSKSTLLKQTGKFSVLIDMRTLKPLPADAQPVMQEGQKLYKTKGMERSCVILANSIITLQFQRIAKETGIYAFERYIDASKNANWLDKALRWLKNAEDPDKQ
ncbi:MAG: hypothetical protein ABIJ34_02745 [archaeon]